MDSKKFKTLIEKIKFLYGEDYLSVYKQIEKLIIDFNKDTHINPDEEGFSERDIFLIVYPNHFRSPGEYPLQTLTKFLTKFAQGIFSHVHILPFYPYSSDDGFAVIDYYKIKKEYGSWQDIHELTTKFKIVFDFVPNHVSASNQWFLDFLKGEEAFQNYFIWFDQKHDYSKVYRPRVHPLLTKFKTQKGEKYVWTTFSTDQIDLNANNPQVLIELVKILLFYISQGARAIRIDAVGYLWKDITTTSVHLPQTHMIIKIFRDIIELIDSKTWLIPQANTQYKLNTAYWGNGHDEANLVYNFTLAPLLLYTFIKEDASILTKWAKKIKPMSDQTTFLNITATHDGIGLQPIKDLVSRSEINEVAKYVSQRGGLVSYKAIGTEGKEPYEINSVYRSALGSNKKFLATQAIQISFQGIPAIYLNSVLGEENWVQGVKKYKYNRIINRRKFDYQQLEKDLLNSNTKRGKIYSKYTQLLKIRTNEKLFNPTVSQQILKINSKLFVTKRTLDSENLLCVTNTSSEKVVMKSITENKLVAIDLITGKNFDLNRNIELSPFRFLWLKYHE